MCRTRSRWSPLDINESTSEEISQGLPARCCTRSSARRGGFTEMAMRPGMPVSNQRTDTRVITRFDEGRTPS